MGLNLLIIVQTTLYFLAFFLSFFVSVPLGITKSNFLGGCILYANVEYFPSSNRFQMHGGPASNCNYCIGMTVLTLLYGLVIGVIHFIRIMYLRKGEPKEFLGFLNVAIVPVAFAVTFFMFITACITSVGYTTFCKELKDIPSIAKCSDVQKVQWNNNNIDSTGFVARLEMAEACSWILFIIWGVLSAIYGFQIYRNGWRSVLLNQKKEEAGSSKNAATPTGQDYPADNKY